SVLIARPSPRSTLFPYTTLFRSQGRSNFVYRVKGTNEFVSYNLKDDYDTTAMHVDIKLVYNDQLDLDKFRKWRKDLSDATFVLRSEEHTSELQSRENLVCRLLLE